MKRLPEPLRLRNGKAYTLRSAAPEDAGMLLQYLKDTCAETPYLSREPEEITMTVQEEAAFLASQEQAPRALMLTAFYEDKVAGNASFAPVGASAREAHRCSVAIALYRAHCGQGLGEALFSRLLELAKAAGYTQAELSVVSENRPAIALYQKLGFVRCGILPHAERYPDGHEAEMWLFVKRL